jgi:hypothetical protein
VAKKNNDTKNAVEADEMANLASRLEKSSI